MAIEYSARTLKAAIRASNQSPEYQDTAATLLDEALRGKTRLKDPHSPSRGPAPDLPFPNTPSVELPLTFADAQKYREEALHALRTELQATGQTSDEIATAMAPFQRLHDELSQVVATDLEKNGLADVLPVQIDSDISLAIDVFAERPRANQEFTAVTLLDTFRDMRGLTLAQMGERIRPENPLSRARITSLIHRNDSTPSFRAFAQFLHGVGIDSLSPHAILFAVQLARDFHQAENPNATAEYTTVSFAKLRAYYAGLSTKPKSLGEFLRFLREQSVNIRREIAENSSIGTATIFQNESNQQLPYPNTLFRTLESLGYYPGSAESILAVQLALEATEA